MVFIKKQIKNARPYFSGTSMKTKYLYLRRSALRRFTHIKPRQLWIGVTYRCQSSCPHCIFGPQLNRCTEELSREEICAIVEDARRLGFLEVFYFGGEPLLREDIVDLVRYSSEKGLLTSIYTNGMLLTREKAVELRKAGLFLCNVSLDSASRDLHDNLRGVRGCFEKAVDGIRYVQEVGVKCSIWTYVKKRDLKENNLADLKGLIEMGRQLRVSNVFVLFPMASGNWSDATEHILTEAERIKVRDLYNPPLTVLEFPDETTHCSAGKRLVYVAPSGDVSPCPTIPRFFGNINEVSLGEILKRIERGFLSSAGGYCGECIMNKSEFRESIGMDGYLDDESGAGRRAAK